MKLAPSQPNHDPKLQKQSMRFLIPFFAMVFATNAKAESNAWNELFRAMQFADVNRARLEFDCRENPLFSSAIRLKALCEKRHLIPDSVIEKAALPYLKRYVSEPLMKRAIFQLSSDTAISVGRKLILEIQTGKQNQLTPDDAVFLKQQNESEVGRALSAFAADREQGIAVARAMLEYVQQSMKN